MPLYDYQCFWCKAEKKDFFKPMNAAPPQCHGEMQQVYQTKIEVFDTSMVFEHIDVKPMQFPTKRALRDYCRSKDLTSHYGE